MGEFPELPDNLAKSIRNLRRQVGYSVSPARSASPPGVPPFRRAAEEEPSPARSSRRLVVFGIAAAAIHFGLPNGEDAGAAANAVARGITRVSTGLRDQARSGAAQIAEALPGPSFFTDFSEPEPLDHWWQLSPAALTIEPFEKRMSAVPRGASLVRPTRTMADGQVFFHFVYDNQDATFILRGQDERDCYLMTIAPKIRRGRPELQLTAQRRFGSKSAIIAQEAVTDLRLASLKRPRVSVAMEKDSFAARLHWEERSSIPGWPQTAKELVIATWKDTTFRDGAVGVWGQQPRNKGEFRLLTVAAQA